MKVQDGKGREIEVPEPGEDYESLAAMYSGWSFSEHWRKVVLAAIREKIRGSLYKERVSEKRLEDMSRVDAQYIEFLTIHLKGRLRWEREYKAQGGMR